MVPKSFLNPCLSLKSLSAHCLAKILSEGGLAISLCTIVLVRGSIGVFYAAIPAVSSALIADKIEAQNRTGYMAKLGASNGIGMIL